MNARMQPCTDCLSLTEQQSREVALARCNARFGKLSAVERVRWALENLPGTHALSSSFGAQAAVSLHMLTQEVADVPVIFTDTGYLFPETYRFVDELTARFNLNLKTYSSEVTPAWQEARHGSRWQQSPENLAAYNADNKVEPMKRALRELNVGTWFAGLRRSQSSTRQATSFIEWHGGRWKVHPIADWTDHDVHRYLKKHDLPYHPLWAKGYVSIGDVHSTRPIHDARNLEDTRFSGYQRECGLHEIDMSGL
jgi:phosphoadenosine phosphosulfate reductase